MQLSVPDVCRLLNVPERTLYRWIRGGSLPACKVGDEYRFNRVELMEWATRERISISPEIFQSEDQEPLVAAALSEGGVHAGISGSDKESVLRAVVALLSLPPGVDREVLFSVLMAREWLESTGVGDGIAIPHVRNPLVFEIPRPQIALCYLERPIDFGAVDGKPVSILFTLLSPTMRTHLQILSRLPFLLKDPEFREALRRQAPIGDILPAVRRIEAGIHVPGPGDAGPAPDSGARGPATRY